MGGIPCALMRGGTSKGPVILASDLPADPAERDALVLRVMGGSDPRQIDGLGGAHPLTSKVAVVSRSSDDEADLDYLFLQVVVGEAVVSTSQTCGNMLAAVVPFAISRGLVDADGPVRVRLVNTGSIATLRVGPVEDTVSAVAIDVAAGELPLLPTGRPIDVLDGVEATCVDNGMPSVVVRAADLGLTGAESPSALEADLALAARIRAIRSEAVALMGLDPDLDATTTPKIVLVSAPLDGGTIATRTFIPVRVHQAIGVLGAASVAAAVALPGTVVGDLAAPIEAGRVRIEHPTGCTDLHVEVHDGAVTRTTLTRTARLIMDGVVHPAPEEN